MNDDEWIDLGIHITNCILTAARMTENIQNWMMPLSNGQRDCR